MKLRESEGERARQSDGERERESGWERTILQENRGGRKPQKLLLNQLLFVYTPIQ